LKRFFRENGLSLVWFGLFFFTFIFGQTIAGFRYYNTEQREHGEPEITYQAYLKSPHFLEATMENWESEFLQMFFFVALTAFLYQKGSAESKKLEEREPTDEDPRSRRNDPRAPWPVRRGGVVLRLYEHSLSLAFLMLFLICFYLHAAGGAREYTEDQLAHGNVIDTSAWEYMTTSRFWFESLQNWQSEFLAVGTMVVLSIYLRQRGSPESKPVAAPHSQTGKD
jgi:hypothetical protein